MPEEEKATLNATSKCVYNECDGGGFIYRTDENGNSFGRHCRCEEYRIMQERMSFANIPKEFESLTVNSFDTDLYEDAKNRALAQNIKRLVIGYINDFNKMKSSGKGLYFYSETKGSGKTRLAISIGNALIIRKGAAVKFTTTLNLLEEIKDTWSADAKTTQSKLVRAVKSVDVLILDDFGTEKPTSWVNEIFYNILNDRLTAKKVTIFTSNCRIEELHHDERIVNRLFDMAVPVMFPDESIRKAKAKRENEEILMELIGKS